jgi:hypothetical protein
MLKEIEERKKAAPLKDLKRKGLALKNFHLGKG